MTVSYCQSVTWKDWRGVTTFNSNGHATPEDALWRACRAVYRHASVSPRRLQLNRTQREALVSIAMRKLGERP